MSQIFRPYPSRRRPHRASPSSHARIPSSIALPSATNAFRLPGGGGDPAWFGDDMGGIVDPSDPSPSRRDFLIRAAVAAGALSVGGAINVLTMALAGALR